MQDAARVAGALSEPSRLAILNALLEGEGTVSDLASRLGLAQPRLSSEYGAGEATARRALRDGVGGTAPVLTQGRTRATPGRSASARAYLL